MPAEVKPAEQAASLTLGRACEIERGEGRPSTEAERAAFEKWKQTPYARKLARDRERTAPIIREGKRIYESAARHEKRWLGNMTHAEVVAWYRAVKRERTTVLSATAPLYSTPATARPRERRFRRTRSSPSRGDPDPEPEGHLEVVPPSRFRRDVRRWLEEAA